MTLNTTCYDGDDNDDSDDCYYILYDITMIMVMIVAGIK